MVGQVALGLVVVAGGQGELFTRSLTSGKGNRALGPLKGLRN